MPFEAMISNMGRSPNFIRPGCTRPSLISKLEIDHLIGRSAKRKKKSLAQKLSFMQVMP